MNLSKKKEKRPVVQIPKPDKVYKTPSGKIIKFNEQQYEAICCIQQWLVDPSELLYTLSGYAGTGKSSIVGYIIQNLSKVVVSAPTHKAKIIISKMTGKEGETIQSLLGLKPNTDLENFSIADPQFDPIGEKKIQLYKLVVIDEASMFNKDLYDLLLKEARVRNTKVLFMGDEAQLPPINENKSIVFRNPNISQLTKVERQASDNPLMRVYDSIRDNILLSEDVFEHSDVVVADMGIQFTKSEEEFTKCMIGAFKSEAYKEDRNHVRTITYTNKAVMKWNQVIRKAIMGETECIVEPGDLLMAYNNVRLGKQEIYNSADYEVMNVIESTNRHGIEIYRVELRDIDDDTRIYTHFLVPEKENIAKFRNIADNKIKEAKTSTGKNRSIAWAQYYEFKNQHLLMEKLGDMKKDFDYGYAITVHKAQGSTYKEVFIDEDDIDTCRKDIDRNKLKYVALSRPTNMVYSLSQKTEQIADDPVPWNDTTNSTEALQQIDQQIEGWKEQGLTVPPVNAWGPVPGIAVEAIQCGQHVFLHPDGSVKLAPVGSAAHNELSKKMSGRETSDRISFKGEKVVVQEERPLGIDPEGNSLPNALARVTKDLVEAEELLRDLFIQYPKYHFLASESEIKVVADAEKYLQKRGLI